MSGTRRNQEGPRGSGRSALRAGLVLLSSVSALACGPGPVTFQFRPDEGANYHLREAQEVRSTTTARGGVGVERAAMAARMEVTRPDSWRWGFVVTIEEMELYDEGVRRTGDDPGLAAFIGRR